uniref:Uncharacterized protein n=1 Tax=Neobodo designis TaxID=312471 RepID=A0A7S1PX63_NEODS|mmetsp:Transcript_2410/g.7505  ORF Transcript_2410/g.7505 Transcript_2410/m.7505 type:complete len:386 (+) Transcript_2410:35-1192(+)
MAAGLTAEQLVTALDAARDDDVCWDGPPGQGFVRLSVACPEWSECLKDRFKERTGSRARRSPPADAHDTGPMEIPLPSDDALERAWALAGESSRARADALSALRARRERTEDSLSDTLNASGVTLEARSPRGAPAEDAGDAGDAGDSQAAEDAGDAGDAQASSEDAEEPETAPDCDGRDPPPSHAPPSAFEPATEDAAEGEEEPARPDDEIQMVTSEDIPPAFASFRDSESSQSQTPVTRRESVVAAATDPALRSQRLRVQASVRGLVSRRLQPPMLLSYISGRRYSLLGFGRVLADEEAAFRAANRDVNHDGLITMTAPVPKLSNDPNAMATEASAYNREAAAIFGARQRALPRTVRFSGDHLDVEALGTSVDETTNDNGAAAP